MLTQEQIQQYKDFGARLESVYADSPEQLEAIKSALKGFEVLCENENVNGGTAGTMDVNIGGMTQNKTGSDLHTPGQLRKGYDNAGKVFNKVQVKPVSEGEMLRIQKALLRWGQDKPVECYKWVTGTLIPKLKTAFHLSNADAAAWGDKNTEDMFKSAVAGDDQAAAEKESKDAAKKQAFADKAKAIDDKEAELKDSNKAYGDDDQKLSKWDQLKRWYYKKRAGLKEAVERGDMAMVEAIEAELKACQGLLESIGFDIEALMD